MIGYEDINNKQGTALDFIIYVVASDVPNCDSIHSFFFQKHIRKVLYNIPFNSAQIERDALRYHCELKITSYDKSAFSKRVVRDRLDYYANEMIFEEVEISNFIDDYFEYIDSFIDITSYITNNDKVDFSSFEFIEEIYNDDEIKEILENINFFLSQYEKYNDETKELDIINTDEQKIDITNLKEYFEEYISLRTTLPNIFVSYYASLLNLLQTKEGLKLNRSVSEIKANINSPVIEEVSSKVRYLQSLIHDNEKLLFKYSFEVPQLDGFFDETTPIITIYDSLWNYFHIIKNSGLLDFFFINGINPYVYKSIESQHSVYGMKLKILNQLLYGEREVLEEDLNDEFNSFIDRKYNFIDYLGKKNFNKDEIRIIINALSENRYNEFDIRNMNLSRDIYFFRFCYFFYIFDFFEEIEGNDFNTIISFEDIVRFNSNNKRENKQQYHKNYISVNNPNSKDYPFASKRTAIFLSKIESALGIGREKLKQIPEVRII